MELCRNSIKSLALFLFFSRSSAVTPEGFHCSCFLRPMGPKKLSRYSSHVVSPSLSGIPCSVYQLSMPLMKSRKSSNCSDEFQSKVGGFRESVGEPLISVKAFVKALMMASMPCSSSSPALMLNSRERIYANCWVTIQQPCDCN